MGIISQSYFNRLVRQGILIHANLVPILSQTTMWWHYTGDLLSCVTKIRIKLQYVSKMGGSPLTFLPCKNYPSSKGNIRILNWSIYQHCWLGCDTYGNGDHNSKNCSVMINKLLLLEFRRRMPRYSKYGTEERTFINCYPPGYMRLLLHILSIF